MYALYFILPDVPQANTTECIQEYLLEEGRKLIDSMIRNIALALEESTEVNVPMLEVWGRTNCLASDIAVSLW